MNKTEIVKILANKFDMAQNKTDEIVSTFLETITKSLANGDDVTFIGFGTFSIKKRAARTGRNPQTGAALKIPARKVVRFSVGKALKEAVNKK